MKVLTKLSRPFILLTFLMLFAIPGRAQTTSFTYQGRLTDGGTPANGTYDLQFKLYDALTSGSLQGSPNTVTRPGVLVTNGIFTVQLDFGASGFPGADRYLDIGVKHPADGSYTPLLPRQQLTSSPLAIRSLNAANADTATNATQLGSVAANQYVQTTDPRLSDPRPPTANSANYIQNTISPQASSNFSVTGSGTIAGSLTAGSLIGNGAGVTNVPGTFNWQIVSGTSQIAQPKLGYLVTNAAEVTVTLPAAPAVGDIFRISGAGAGGWKIAQNSGQRILSPIFTAVNWTQAQSWQSVASSADGTKLAVAPNGTQIITSSDSGVSWTPRDSNRFYYCIASSADGSKLVAGTINGQLYTSTDSGATFTPRESSRVWISVASSADGVKLLAAAQSGQLYTSTDSGVTWFPRDSVRTWFSVASSSDGVKLVAIVQSGQIYTSTDSGLTWFARDSVRSWLSVASSSDGSKLVAIVIGGQIYTSIDSGVTWTPRETIRSWYAVTSSGDGSKLAAIVQIGQIYTSTDSGLTWTPRYQSLQWSSITSSADGVKLCAVVSGGQIYNSTDSGVTWTTTIRGTLPGAPGFLTGGQSTAIELQYIGGGQFLPLSHEGTLISH